VTTKIEVLSFILSKNVAVFIKKMRIGWARVAGESTPEPCRTTKGKKRGEKEEKTISRPPGVVKGEGY
jgi:hypothetical protein